MEKRIAEVKKQPSVKAGNGIITAKAQQQLHDSVKSCTGVLIILLRRQQYGLDFGPELETWTIFLIKIEKRQMWAQPIEWLKLNFASCVVHLCFTNIR